MGCSPTRAGSIELRVREAGLSIEWYEASDWCDDVGRLASVVDDIEPGRVVVAFDDGATSTGNECAEAAAAAFGDTDTVAVLEPGAGPDPATLAAAGFDTDRPDPPDRRARWRRSTLPCEWWEQPCAPERDGRFATPTGASPRPAPNASPGCSWPAL